MSAQDNKITVTHYGVHWDQNNVAYLMQGRGGTNAIGLKERAPFYVRLPGRSRLCNHQIPLAVPVPNDVHWDFFIQLLNDPLVQAMLPVPKSDAGVYFINEVPNILECAVLLTKMSSPIYPPVQPMWNMNQQAILNELETTNVQPLLITEVEAKDSPTIAQIAKYAMHKPRTLVLIGKDDVVLPPIVKRVTTELTTGKYSKTDLITQPWETLGAVAVRKYMRGEWPPAANPAQGSHDPNQPKAKSPPIRRATPS